MTSHIQAKNAKRAARIPVLSALPVLPALLLQCAEPTAMTMEVFSEVPCEQRPTVGVRVGDIGDAFSTTSNLCSASGRVGSIVLFPSAAKDALLSVQVLTRVDGGDPATCTESNKFAKCIVAKRKLRLAPNQSTQMRVDLRLSCEGVVCGTDETCAKGQCAPAAVACSGTNCFDDTAILAARPTPTPLPPSARSCKDVPRTCGPRNDEDCCASPEVPGGTFFRSYDGVTFRTMPEPTVDLRAKANEATVAKFRLDRFEVTWARFEAFLNDYPASIPPVGSGKNPNTASDEGLNATWRAQVLKYAATAAEVRARISADRVKLNLPTTPANREPVTAIPWAMAMAFCAWDDARLPSEAEWNFAGAGGPEQRIYPWSTPPQSTLIAADRANMAPATGEPTALALVGSTSPLGDSKYGQADMAGNAWEWVYGARTETGYMNPCVNCIEPPTNVAQLRGASYRERISQPEYFAAGARNQSGIENVNASFGFRCARNP
jgi:formylglycine-generating enzyme